VSIEVPLPADSLSPVWSEGVIIWTLYRETTAQLDMFLRRVQEGKDISAAHDFARYVTWSAIGKLCMKFGSASPLPVDGSLLMWKAEELIRRCQERYITGDSKPHIELTELEKINRNIEVLACQVAKLSAPAPEKVNQDSPELKLIQGGHWETFGETAAPAAPAAAAAVSP
jgi:hypothetical protein